MPNPRILVVDDDAWILRMVTTVLGKRGYDIVTAEDGEDALELANEKTPNLVITDVMMPRMDGWAFVKQLRSTPKLAFVPVIFLTALSSDEDRIRGFRLGADDYLPKPFRFEELDLRVAKALKRRVDPPAPVQKIRSAGPAIQGALDQLGLSSLLIVLEMERKSGVLILAKGKEKARIFLKQGRVVQARYDDRPEPINAEAVYELLTWSAGSFEFSGFEVDMEDEIDTPTTGLLIEGARRIDEARAQD
ncbi:MAG TPA: response regulator [Haliangiales bacterium]|nr:response regulator [Haliangiales bacterium]